MDTDEEFRRDKWIEEHEEEYDLMKSTEWIAKEFPKVYEQFWKDVNEHSDSCKDPYYRYCYGCGRVPIPCCYYCTEYDGDRCHKEWNNNDECYYIDWRDDKESDELCEDYEWNGEWEDV